MKLTGKESHIHPHVFIA